MKPEELNNQLFELAGNILNENNSLSYRLKGHSMYPTLKPGDIGFIEKCSPEQLKIGDIVVFKANNLLVGHRLIDMYFDKGVRVFVTKGDKSPTIDAPFSGNELLGRMTSFQRKKNIKKLDSPIKRFQGFIALHFSKYSIPVVDLLLRINGKSGRLTSGFKSIKNNISAVTKHSEKVLLVNVIIAILQGVLPFVVIVCIKSLIDNLTGTSAINPAQRTTFILLLVVTALVFLANGILSEVRSYFSEKLSQSVIRRIYEKLHHKHASLDLSHYENHSEQDKIHRAVQEASFRPIKIINELLTGIKSVAAALFLVGLFINIRWYLIVLLTIAIIPGIFFRLKFSRKLYKLKESQSTKEREMYYYNRVLTGFPFAKEMKLFGFFIFFKQRFINVQESLFEEKIALRKSELWMGIFSQAFAVILIFISLGFVSYLRIKGEISTGTVVLFFFTFQRGYSVLNDFFRSITQILEDNTFLNDFMDFLNMPTASNSTDQLSAFSLTKGIQVQNVSFRYETSKRDALKSINLSIPAKKTVAFVGANGSGKTTLIKLLCGFYQPVEGKILFDGVDSTQLGQNKICENITAVFQDFALYNIPAIENLGLGNINTPLQLEKARKAAQEAGIDEVLQNLPDGYNTMLGNLFKGGEELSIGQWQKIAIARAFYRDSPLILMDEPSSALDADAELQIINSLKKLSENKTAVIISHRLSTVQWADIIYFFEEGEVIESGSHAELMSKKGKYYSLFLSVNNS